MNKSSSSLCFVLFLSDDSFNEGSWCGLELVAVHCFFPCEMNASLSFVAIEFACCIMGATV
jgi:hypothetical protein